MNILYLTHRLPYAPNRGDRIRAYHMLRYLAARHDVDLVCFAHDEEEARHEADLRGIARSTTVLPVRRTRNLPRAAGALLSGGTLTHALLHARGVRQKIGALVARRRPDIVLAYCSGMARFALEGPLSEVPLVLDLVDVDSEKWAQLGRTGCGPMAWIYRREARLLRQFERLAVARARATLVVNTRELESVRALTSDHEVEVVPNGIDVPSFRPPGPPVSEPRVVFCGVMDYAPNVSGAEWLARHVWPAIRAARPDARLTLVGANPIRSVKDLARADPSIEVTGRVPDVRTYLWDAAVAAAPLLVARGLQNKVLEAVAAGVPTVVTSAVGAGLPDEVRPACAVADSADGFAAHVLKLLARKPDERRAIAGAARLDSLDWNHRLARIDEILAQAADASYCTL